MKLKKTKKRNKKEAVYRPPSVDSDLPLSTLLPYGS
jgi:hypothetical protein